VFERLIMSAGVPERVRLVSAGAGPVVDRRVYRG
jgi:hypothetical protein